MNPAQNPEASQGVGQGRASPAGPGLDHALTPEERQVFRECNTESFWYRCVPLGVLFIGTSQILTNKGFLKPHPRYGALFKNIGASLVAFFVGKFSYQSTCVEKFLRLENSPLADRIRQGKRGSTFVSEMTTPYVNPQLAPGPQANDAKLTDEYNAGDNDSETRTQKFQITGLDDAKRPDVDGGSKGLPVDTQVSQAPVTSYDDLRRKNRIEYERKMSIVKPPGPQPSAPDSRSSGLYPPQSSSRPQLDERPKRVRKNQWGDEIEE